ncbi:MAG: hypothetical protein HYX49_05475 [Chloroflexi bacterium]|nr:hypothetical protein [Chloroflexota bacterium]
MFRKFLVSFVALLFALSIPASALAQQNYLFSVDKELVDVYWNADGSESIEYTFVFTNQPGAYPIDFVDVGMPNSNYDMSTVTADVNGNPVSVSQSDYQGSGSGFAVVMGSQAIDAGASGTVRVYVGRITGVLYPDTSDSNYASGEFAPTYFGSQYVVGKTDMTVTFHLPPGVKPEEPRWHTPPAGFPSEPQTGLDANGRVTYTWNNTNANAYSSYNFGASFPKSYIPDSAIVQTNSLEVIFGLILGLFSFVAGSLPCLIFAALFFGIPILGVIQGQRRKLQYIPPRIGIEGHGIKRGLTAVESAMLMEQPLDKVMTMILFGVIKKGAASVVSRDPLKVQATEPPPDGLHDYEMDFLNAFKEDNPKTRQSLLQEMMVKLIRSVTEKMKGFSRKETQDYYKSIMEQAWSQVEAAATPEVKSQKFDENLEWTMLDKDYDDRTRRVFTGPIYAPLWWGHYDPAYRPLPSTSAPVSTSPASGQPPTFSAPRLPGSDFAASVVGGVQTFSQKVIGDVSTFTSKVTNVTNPPPKPSASSYRGGGGCACACAGCACACAGGGR